MCLDFPKFLSTLNTKGEMTSTTIRKPTQEVTMSNAAPPKEGTDTSAQPAEEAEPVTTPYADALTRQTRIDYQASAGGSSAGDEIKLSRAMTLRALRVRKYSEARAWQQTLSTALRIQAKAEGLQTDRSGTIGILLQAAADTRIAISTDPDDPASFDEESTSAAEATCVRPPSTSAAEAQAEGNQRAE